MASSRYAFKTWISLHFLHMLPPSLKPKSSPDFSSSFLIKLALSVCTFSCLAVLFYSFYHSQSGLLHRTGYSLVRESDPFFRPRDHDHRNAKIDETNLSHIVFGIGGSARSWHIRRPYVELWWGKNTRGYVWLDRSPLQNETWPETSPPYRVSGDTSKFKYTCWYGSRSALHIARIIKESFELGLDNVRWFVMGDDDTVFFVENLVTVLRRYDHNQMYYIGGNSESVEQDVIHSYNMAYGGGGFAVSYPLAKELVGVLDGCIDRYHSSYGSDQKIQGCLTEIGVPVSKELGFHQVDIRGDPYGLLAAHPLAPLVSLHHLDYVKPIFPFTDRINSLNKLHNAYKFDPSRTLQHTFCYDLKRNWSVSVSWGYTIQIYPSLKTAKELGTAFQTFKSWRTWRNGPFVFNTRLMSEDQCERPVIYFLDRVERVSGDVETLTTYKRYVEDDKQSCDRPEYEPVTAVEFVNVWSTTLNPDIWDMAPRRQCCEIVNGENKSGNIVQVHVRSCKPFESVTPVS